MKKIKINKEPPNFTMCGLKIFDPRDNTFKFSNNPALVLNDLCERFNIRYDLKEKLGWVDFLKKMADCCDKLIEDKNES